jgi:hypothetical protein
MARHRKFFGTLVKSDPTFRGVDSAVDSSILRPMSSAGPASGRGVDDWHTARGQIFRHLLVRRRTLPHYSGKASRSTTGRLVKEVQDALLDDTEVTQRVRRPSARPAPRHDPLRGTKSEDHCGWKDGE